MAIKERWTGTRPVSKSTDDVIREALSLFRPDPRMLAVYLFGSRAVSGESADSDVDLAFHSAPEFTWDDFYILNGSLAKILKSDRIDLLWMNIADAIINFEVLKSGRLIYYRDSDVLNEFELSIKKRYWDYSLYLEKRSYPA